MKFQDETIPHVVTDIELEIAKHKRKQGRLTDGRDFVDDIKPLQAADTWTAIASFLSTPFIKFGTRKGSKALEKRIIGGQKKHG